MIGLSLLVGCVNQSDFAASNTTERPGVASLNAAEMVRSNAKSKKFVFPNGSEIYYYDVDGTAMLWGDVTLGKTATFERELKSLSDRPDSYLSNIKAKSSFRYDTVPVGSTTNTAINGYSCSGITIGSYCIFGNWYPVYSTTQTLVYGPPLWSKNIEYKFDPAGSPFTSSDVARVSEELDRWRVDTSVTFIYNPNTVNGILFHKPLLSESQSCSSPIGRQAAVNGTSVTQSVLNYVNLPQWCINRPGLVAHEVGHSLGLYHEHQRPDRDSFILIDRSAVDELNPNYSQAQRDAYFNGQFAITANTYTSLSFDFLSIMLYGSTYCNDSSTICRTILRKKTDNSTWLQPSNTSATDRFAIYQFYVSR